jgi:hypothetical protein
MIIEIEFLVIDARSLQRSLPLWAPRLRTGITGGQKPFRSERFCPDSDSTTYSQSATKFACQVKLKKKSWSGTWQGRAHLGRLSIATFNLKCALFDPKRRYYILHNVWVDFR